MTSRVGVEFDGSSRGALRASNDVSLGIRKVRQEAAVARPQLRGLDGDLGRVTRGALAGSGAFHGLGRSLAFASSSFLGGAGFTFAVRQAITAASDLNEQGNKASVVFRGYERDVLAWAKTTTASFGISERAALSYSATFGNLLIPMGFARREAAAMSRELVQLASDMASFNNASPEEVLQAIQSGLAGEIEPLRRYGVFLNQVRIQHELASKGIHGTWMQLTQAQKAWATYQIILQDTKDAQGDFGRTSNETANQLRILHAAVEDFEAMVGKALLPEVKNITHSLNDWLQSSENQVKVQHAVETAFKDLKAVLHDAGVVIGEVDKLTGGWKETLELLLALKVASTLAGWTTAINVMTGAEAAGTGVAGAAGATGLLNKRLERLRVLTSKPFQFVIAYEIIKKITGSNADLSNDAGGPGDLMPVYRNGKWVDPATGTPVADQAYWNRQFQRANPGSKPSAGASAGSPGATTKQQALVRTAEELGPGSGGIYATGGRGALLDTPTGQHTVYDCSGYLVAIYAKNGITIPPTSETQWADPNAIKVPKGQEQPADGVYFEAKGNGYAPPGHCGIYIGGGRFIEYYSSGKPARISNLADRGDYWGARRWVKIKQRGGAAAGSKPDTGPPKGDGSGTAASKNVLPARIRGAISAAGVAAAAAALTPGKADDRAAVAKQRAALDDEIAWLNAKLKTKLGAEKRITLEDLLTGALTDLKSLDPTKAKTAKGASITAVTSLRASVNEQLKGLPASLDDVEQNAVAKLTQLRNHLKVGMSAKDLADTRASIKRWGNVLKDEISKQSALASDAAQETARLWQRTWENDVAKVLRSFQEDVVDKQLDDFDRATQAGLKRIAARYGAETPEERALREFQEGRTASDAAQRKADLQAQIADVQAQLAALGVAPAGAGSTGTLIDIATGTRTALASAVDKSGEDMVAKRKDLEEQLLGLQHDYHELELDDQEAALERAAELAREAADERQADEEGSYQRERERLRLALSDRLQDEQTELEQSLDDWNINIEKKKDSWAAFLQWLSEHGYATAGLVNPAASGAAAVFVGHPDSLPGGRGGFARGGKVPGRYYGRDDTIAARLTPGETVIDRDLTRALEEMVRGGGRAGGPLVTIVAVDGREIVRQTSTPMTAEQARQIGYRLQRF